MDRRNLSVYLDELDDDPARACQMARSAGVSSVCLRRVWATNIGKATDEACKRIMSSLKANSLTVLAVCTDDGRAPADSLALDGQQGAALKRSLSIASYFKAKFFRPFAGMAAPNAQLAAERSAAWMAHIGTECTRSVIVPLLEVDPDAYAFAAADVAAALERHKAWRLLYDPALLVVRRNQNPFLKYWQLLRSKVAAVDLHDFKTGLGFVPIGAGSCLLAETIRDAVASGFAGWFIVEPGYVRRTGVGPARAEVMAAVTKSYLAAVASAKADVAAWAASQPGGKHGKKRA